MIEIATAIESAGNFKHHPLGFFYLLRQFEDGLKHRVHVWLSDSEDSLVSVGNDCHQHSFDIHSNIRLGCIKSDILEFSERPNGTKREFEVIYEDGGSSILPTGRIGILNRKITFECGSGSCYFLAAGVIHRVSVITRPCITLLTTEERGIPIRSYGEDVGEEPSKRRAVNDLEKMEIIKLLKLVE